MMINKIVGMGKRFDGKPLLHMLGLVPSSSKYYKLSYKSVSNPYISNCTH